MDLKFCCLRSIDTNRTFKEIEFHLHLKNFQRLEMQVPASFITLVFVICSTILSLATALHESFNFVVPAKKRECFFEDVSKKQIDAGEEFKIEVFLESGGNVDITLTFHGPLGLGDVVGGDFEAPFFSKQIDVNFEAEFATQTYITELKPVEMGHYGVCLDNRKSRFLSKMLQLDISAKTLNESPLDLDTLKGKTSSEPEVDVKKITEALTRLTKIQKSINHIQLQQMRDKHRLSLHSDANERNYNEVFISSIIETVIFIGVSIFQIFFVRRWFASRINASRGGAAEAAQSKSWA